MYIKTVISQLRQLTFSGLAQLSIFCVDSSKTTENIIATPLYQQESSGL